MPDPEGPRKVKNSPGSMVRFTLFRTGVIPKDSVMSSMATPSALLLYVELIRSCSRGHRDLRRVGLSASLDEEVRQIRGYADDDHGDDA